MQKRPWSKSQNHKRLHIHKSERVKVVSLLHCLQECGESRDRMSIESNTLLSSVIQDSITTTLIRVSESEWKWVSEGEWECVRERLQNLRVWEREREWVSETIALYSLVLEPVVFVYAATAHSLGARSRCHVCHCSAHRLHESCKSLKT